MLMTFEKFNKQELRDDIQERYQDDHLFLLIDDDGEEHPIEGYYVESVGIFDNNGVEYPAGVRKDGTIIVCVGGDKEFPYAAIKLDGTGPVPGLENALQRGFNYYEGFED